MWDQSAERLLLVSVLLSATLRWRMQTVTVQGVRIPTIGLGTSHLRGDVARRMAGYALGIGYRHIDTAQSYGNEEQIGDAIRESSVPRQEIWLTTKVQKIGFEMGICRIL